jgi:hypothetical protein
MIQDSVLLVDVNNRLFVDLNDAGSRDCKLLIRKIVAQDRRSYMMCLSGYGDADMISFYGDNGIFIPPPAGLKPPPGRQISLRAMGLGIRNVIPFSSFSLLPAQRFDLGAELRHAARRLFPRLRPPKP